MLKTPILFLIFNRPDTTQRIFDEIKKQKPRYLYVAADGPRATRVDDAQKCSETRAILNQIDWDCELKTLFRTENLGCGKAVSGAITWFFENVEQGIILEDDCLPHPDFFGYCEELLNKYRNDAVVKVIGGMNPNFDGCNKIPSSYLFSNYTVLWGWATWKRTWEEYDFRLKTLSLCKFNDILNTRFDFSINLKLYWLDRFLMVKTMCLQIEKNYPKRMNTWDYQVLFSIWENRGLSVIPIKNLVRNIGFGENALHTQKDPFDLGKLKLESILPLIHPGDVLSSYDYDKFIEKTFHHKSIVKNILRFNYHLLIYWFAILKNHL